MEIDRKYLEISASEDSDNIKKQMLEETEKIKSGLPKRIRLAWDPGTSPKEIAENINKVHDIAKKILIEHASKIILDVGGISVSETSVTMTSSGKEVFSKGSLALGVWQGRVLWYDEIHEVPFWVLRKNEVEHLQTIGNTLIPWANSVVLPDCMETGTPEENKKVLTSAPIVMRLHPGTDIDGLEVSLITWPELTECCQRVQHAIHILRRCIMFDKGITETEQGNKVTKGEQEGMIKPIPPEILQKILWVWKYGRNQWKLLSLAIFIILCIWILPKIIPFSKEHQNTRLESEPSQHSSETANIFADVSKDGTILRSNNFPWKIQKTNDKDGNILYTIVDRRGDATAISVVPDNPKYTVYQSWDGMVIKFTCAEEKISDFTIKVKY